MCKLLLLLFFLSLAPKADANLVEIYAGGDYYDSIESYRLKQSLNAQMEAKDEAGLKPDLSAETRQKINALGADGHVDDLVEDFNEKGVARSTAKVVTPEEIEGQIQQAVQDHAQPVLLISDPKKMRILKYGNAEKS